MSFPTPDIVGFGERQDYLRTTLGRDVCLYGPADMIYDPAIAPSQFDDEGIPLDPLAGASAIAPADTEIDDLTLLGIIRANVVFQPLSTALMRRDQVTEQADSSHPTINKDLICQLADKPMLDTADYFSVGTNTDDGWVADDGSLWKIVNVETDGFGALQRVIAYGEGTR